jgi:hypothetical protein
MAKLEFNDKSLNSPIEDPQLEVAKKSAKEIKPPAALKPGIDWDGLEPEITTDPYDSPNPDWDEILRGWGYDPETHEICEPVKVSQWEILQEGIVKTLYSYKAGVKVKSTVRSIDYYDLVKEIKRHRKLSESVPTGDKAFVVCLADWQMGKNDGDGTAGIVGRALEMIDNVEQRIRDLRKIGRKLGLLVVVGMGDIIENCDGQYAAQAFSVELNRREQVRVARRLIRDAICRWAKLFPEVWVTAVAGNHGENRRDGKLFTDPGDNDDVAIFEMVAEILSANPDAYGHVKFFLPEKELSVTLDIAGTRIGFAHGHIAGSGSSPQLKQRKWWSDQGFTNRDIGSATILVTAHYHHLSIVEYSQDKIHIQCPSLESTSDWWVEKTGEDSRPGTLTFVVGDNIYSDLALI